VKQLTIGSESTKNRSSPSLFIRTVVDNKSGTIEWFASMCGQYTQFCIRFTFQNLYRETETTLLFWVK